MNISACRSIYILLAFLGMAAAQVPSERGQTNVGPPSLHLSASKPIKIAPDELVASMLITTRGHKALPAQHQVNALAVQAKAVADSIKGLRTAFLNYSVSFIDEKPSHWIAQQTVQVRGADGEAVLNLVGQLQEDGLSIAPLGWEVSVDRADQAHRAAIITALHTLRDEAAEAAKVLGMQINRFQRVDLLGEPRADPLIRGGMQMAAKVAMPAPVATAQEQDNTATVSADVPLRIPSAERRQAP